MESKMDTTDKSGASEVTKFVENDNGELTDLKLTENEGDKAKENGDAEKKDGEASQYTIKKETGSKDTEGDELGMENEEIDKEMAEFLTEVPTGAVKEELSGTEGPEKSQSKTEQKEAAPKLPMYCEKAIAISGLPIRKLGSMKKMLVEKLGAGTVRIKPRAREEKLLHIYFASEELLNRGKEVLEEQLSYTLKVKIVSGLGLKFMPDEKHRLEVKEAPAATSSEKQPDNAQSSVKRKMEEEEASDEPPAKKDKSTENQDFYFTEESYDEQVKFKNKDAKKIVEEFGKNIRKNIPQLEMLILNRERRNNGLVCKLDELAEVSPARRLFARCKFLIGIDEDTGEVAVGFSAAEGKVKKNCKTRQYFLPNILQEADVFEKLVKSSEREPGQGSTGFWRKLIVRSNTEGKVMLNVVVQAPKEKAQEELEYLKGIITEFYESEAGKDSKVVSVYSKVMYISHRQRRSPASNVALSWGSEYLEEKFLGMRLLLDPKTFFYFNVHAAGVICNTLTELLKPSRRISVIEIGCFSGYVGMHLARFKCEVLCVGSKPASAEAVLKEQSSKCNYYPGIADEVLKTLKMSSTKACAVITTAPQALAPKVSLELRKKPEIKRIVVITEAAGVNNSRALTLLMKPSDSKELGNPFFPKDIVPVDTMPNTKHYTLVIYMERIGMDSLPKPEPAGAHSTMKTGRSFQSRRNVPPNRMGSYQHFGSVWDQQPFPSVLNPALTQPFVENPIITPLNDPKLMYVDILQRQDFINNEILVEEHTRRLMEEREAEIYRQRLLEEKEREAEEYRLRLIEEKEREVEEYRRRLIEEKQREAVEYQRRLQEERVAEEYKQMQLKERLRILEEEEYKRRLLIEARERELRELSSKATIQEVLSNTLKEAAASRLDNEAAGKLKHVIAEAIRGAGILNPKDQAMMHSGQDRMSGTQYSRFAPEHRNPVGGTGVANKAGIRNPREDRNLPFNDNFSRNIRANEREPMGDRRGFDNASYSARMTSGRTDRDAHPKSLDNRDMSYGSRTSKETEAVNKNKPVSLLSLKFHPNIEANMAQEVAADERWRNEDDSMYGRNWTDDLNRGMGRSEAWRTDSKQTGRSDNDPYFRDVRDMKQDNWRSYASDTLTGSTAYGSESRMPVDKDTNRATETGYGSYGSSHNLKPSVYGHIYGRVKQSEVNSYRKPY